MSLYTSGMEKLAASVTVGIVVAIVAALGVLWPGDANRSARRITARDAGVQFAPRRVFRGTQSPVKVDLPPRKLSENSEPDDRGRALVVRSGTLMPLDELRKAAGSGDPSALNDLAAVLVTQAERFDSQSALGDFSGESRDLRYALEAISVLQKALDQAPGLAAAHFNLALALEQVGFIFEAHKEFMEAARLGEASEWAWDARRQVQRLLRSEREIDRTRIARYLKVTSDPFARDILRPYLSDQEQRLRRSHRVLNSDARLSRAADTYYFGIGRERIANSIQVLCKESNVEPCALRYYMAGALQAAGRASEAVVWLRSVDADVYRFHGSAGLEAQLRWEEGLHVLAKGTAQDALLLFEREHASSLASGQRSIAAMFNELALYMRGYVVSQSFFRKNTVAAFRAADAGSSLEDVQARLASAAAILRYATVIDHVAVFVVRKDAVEVVDLPNIGEIATAAAMLRGAGDSSFGQWSSTLHDLAFGPVRDKLEGISTIAVVRNPELAEIPFGALFDAGRGEYLAERYTIVHAPTAKAAVELSQRVRDVSDPTLLAIGATEFDRARYHQAELLPAVEREVAAIAEQSLCARVLSGQQATPEAIQRQLAENAVIHYGGHIVRRGGDVRLLLAPSRKRDSLSATEIAKFRLQKARVAVLAGCGGAAIGDPHGMIPTMAEAFLAAGVPTVIATAYDLEDAAAPPTMRRLHQFLKNGDDAAQALRKTTIDELRTGRGVPLSIRFQAIGGTSALTRSDDPRS